jgi:hypothetical protein
MYYGILVHAGANEGIIDLPEVYDDYLGVLKQIQEDNEERVQKQCRTHLKADPVSNRIQQQATTGPRCC